MFVLWFVFVQMKTFLETVKSSEDFLNRLIFNSNRSLGVAFYRGADACLLVYGKYSTVAAFIFPFFF